MRSPETTRNPARRTTAWIVAGCGALLVLVTVCVACGFGADRFLFHSPVEEPVHRAECDGGSLEITYHAELNRLSGITSQRLAGAWNRGPAFPIDLEAMPHHLRWDRPQSALHGEGPDYVHFFLGDQPDAERIERCAEQHAAIIMAAIDRKHLRWAVPASARGRAYWRARPEQLLREFSDGRRAFEVQRNGTLWLRQGEGGSLLGRVHADPDGPVTLRCCERYDPSVGAEDLPRFLDREGQSLPQRLGVPVTPCTVPGREHTDCTSP